MTKFIAYLKACRDMDRSAATASQVKVKDMFDKQLPRMRDNPQGVIPRLFDNVSPCIPNDRLSRLAEDYAELMQLMQTKADQQYREYKLAVLTQAIYHCYKENMLDYDDKILKELYDILQLDTVTSIGDDDKIQHLILSYVHTVLMDLSKLVEQQFRQEIFSTYHIKTTPNNFVSEIIAAKNADAEEMLQHFVMNTTEIKRLVTESDVAYPGLMAENRKLYAGTIQKFILSYVAASHTAEANKNFLELAYDPALTKMPMTAMFRRTADVVGDNILMHVQHYHPDLLLAAVKNIVHGKEKQFSESESDRVLKIMKSAGIQKKDLSSQPLESMVEMEERKRSQSGPNNQNNNLSK